jgi:hypothetical protein
VENQAFERVGVQDHLALMSKTNDLGEARIEEHLAVVG